MEPSRRISSPWRGYAYIASVDRTTLSLRHDILHYACYYYPRVYTRCLNRAVSNCAFQKMPRLDVQGSMLTFRPSSRQLFLCDGNRLTNWASRNVVATDVIIIVVA